MHDGVARGGPGPAALQGGERADQFAGEPARQQAGPGAAARQRPPGVEVGLAGGGLQRLQVECQQLGGRPGERLGECGAGVERRRQLLRPPRIGGHPAVRYGVEAQHHPARALLGPPQPGRGHAGRQRPVDRGLPAVAAGDVGMRRRIDGLHELRARRPVDECGEPRREAAARALCRHRRPAEPAPDRLPHLRGQIGPSGPGGRGGVVRTRSDGSVHPPMLPGRGGRSPADLPWRGMTAAPGPRRRGPARAGRSSRTDRHAGRS